ncbi:hypothetical protein GCM10010112_90070 [Actinoplanes lobatus]|uniref:Septum formation initiator n=1 Tax=Actinoplanes lobatus TaxID=113568 RepID=A0A7W7HG59_9ACTN|nr:hypothetical protein [Actinoplanes lobatus]MBB4749894.1 hypothetical protein [Actinoplanes lobatus]GGN97585.1 hypothetical protein GCM10010112_90070 [Actinoplanes lobatus]GIE44986.1 hypothetical protein Alo02nite_78840 [Actinoplanes lobatus]
MRLLDRLGRLPLVIVAGWIVAAVLAVLVGVVGIGLVGSGLVSRQGAPISEDEVERALDGLGDASPSTSPEPSKGEPSKGEPSATAARGRSFPTRGGTVVADCERIISMSPAQGFAVHDQDDDDGEFRQVRGEVKVEVELTGCDQGTPRLAVSEEAG